MMAAGAGSPPEDLPRRRVAFDDLDPLAGNSPLQVASSLFTPNLLLVIIDSV